MDGSRRNATEALQHAARVEDFISNGVHVKIKTPNEIGQVEPTDSQEQENANQSKTDRQPQRKARRKSSKPRVDLPTDSASLALAKATIQKTVRFNPKLIARWERLAHSKRASGQTPASFQQVQNDALALWLSKHDDLISES